MFLDWLFIFFEGMLRAPFKKNKQQVWNTTADEALGGWILRCRNPSAQEIAEFCELGDGLRNLWA